MRVAPLSMAMLLAHGGPAVAQDVPILLACSGVAEYTYWAYERIQEAEGSTDLAEHIRLLRIASGVFVQAHVEETGCDTTHDALRAVIQSEANLASDYFGSQMAEGGVAQDILAEFDEIIDQCLGQVGSERFVGFMEEFAENGPPCGWAQ